MIKSDLVRSTIQLSDNLFPRLFVFSLILLVAVTRSFLNSCRRTWSRIRRHHLAWPGGIPPWSFSLESDGLDLQWQETVFTPLGRWLTYNRQRMQWFHHLHWDDLTRDFFHLADRPGIGKSYLYCGDRIQQWFSLAQLKPTRDTTWLGEFPAAGATTIGQAMELKRSVSRVTKSRVVANIAVRILPCLPNQNLGFSRFFPRTLGLVGFTSKKQFNNSS